MNKLITGVKERHLRQNCDERGRVVELLRSDWSEFIKFGQVYITTAYPGAVKAWHYHKKQTDTFICIKGMMKVVLYDSRKNSKTKGMVNEFFVGENNLKIIQIPPEVYHGFKCISAHESIILNIPTNVYNYNNPDEYRLPVNTRKIPYSWKRKDR